MKMTMNDMETELTELLEKCDGTSGTEILKNLTEWMTLENSIRMDSDRQEIDMVAIVSKVIEFTLKEFNKRLPEWQNSSKSMDDSPAKSPSLKRVNFPPRTSMV